MPWCQDMRTPHNALRQTQPLQATERGGGQEQWVLKPQSWMLVAEIERFYPWLEMTGQQDRGSDHGSTGSDPQMQQSTTANKIHVAD